MAAVAVLSFMAGGGVAQAWVYGPLVIRDGSTVLGQVKGDFNQLNDQTGVAGTHQRYDSRPGGSGIYARIVYRFNYIGTCVDNPNCPIPVDQTTRWFDNVWKGEYESQTYEQQANSVRGELKGCMDKNLLPDPCSAIAYKTYNY